MVMRLLLLSMEAIISENSMRNKPKANKASKSASEGLKLSSKNKAKKERMQLQNIWIDYPTAFVI